MDPETPLASRLRRPDTRAAPDPAVTGLWKRAGTPDPATTYEITTSGEFHIADPARPLSFSADGLRMDWGAIAYAHTLGTPGQLVGVWTDMRDGDEWYFRADGGVTVHWSPTEENFGRYALRNGGATLWYAEFRGLIATSGGTLTLDAPYLPLQTFAYAATADTMTWSDPVTGAQVLTFARA